jgi:hypothetical protein
MPAVLKAILQVEKEESVLCQQPGCAHGVYRATHVIEEDGKTTVLGSTCFKKKFGRADALGSPSYGGSGGRRLTPAERQLLIDNTAALLERFEQERVAEDQLMRERVAAMRAELARRTQPQLKQSAWSGPRKEAAPWEWVKPMSSVAHFPMKDGTSWVRVMHRDGFHMLMPWPWFDGWDEVFPASLGTVDHELGGIKVEPTVSALSNAVGYVKQRANKMKVGTWREIFAGEGPKKSGFGEDTLKA